jgi:hypothetical protein
MGTVAAPAFPLYDMGALTARVRPRITQSVRQPAYPLYDGWGLHGMGDAAPGLITAGSAVGAKAATGWLTSSGTIATGSALVPIIGTAIAVLGAIIAGLWAAHDARAAGAKTENAQVSSAVQAFDGGMHAIFDAANSSDPSKNISASQAAQQVQQLYSDFWARVCNYTRGPGRADTSGCGSNCGGPTSTTAPCAGMPYGHKCDKSCTVSCCVGCQDIKPSVDMAVAVFQAGGGTVQVCNVAGDRYGLSSRGGYSLTYRAPTISPISSVTGAASGLLSELTGGSGGPSGGGSMLPLLALAAVAFFALR